MLYFVFIFYFFFFFVFIYLFFFFFFFSSRRRHTRSLCDWSSDVCSSDLLISAANDHLPNRMVTDSAKPFVPLNVLRWSKALRFLSSLLLALTHKKIQDRKSVV